MPPMAARRICRMRLEKSSCHMVRLGERSISGNTIELQTMIDSATVSTITIAVAADSPPMKATIASKLWPCATGKASTKVSPSTGCPLNSSIPAIAMGTTKMLIITRYRGNIHAALRTSWIDVFSTTVT